MEGKVFWKDLLVLCHPVGIEYYVFDFGSIIVRKCVHPVRLRLPPLRFIIHRIMESPRYDMIIEQ